MREDRSKDHFKSSDNCHGKILTVKCFKINSDFLRAHQANRGQKDEHSRFSRKRSGMALSIKVLGGEPTRSMRGNGEVKLEDRRKQS